MTDKEIEKRFLVTELARDFPYRDCSFEDIEQGYLASPPGFRVRIINGSATEITHKTGRGTVRGEFKNHDAPPSAIRFLFKHACAHRLAKGCYSRDSWRIDFFKPPLEGIILAEIEFRSVNDIPPNLELPTWIGKGFDVTDSLTNHHLARLATLLENTTAKAVDIVLKRLKNKILKIVITGGPGSGKSEILEIIRKRYPQLHCVSETATIIIEKVGLTPGGDDVNSIRFQETVYRVQTIFEATSAEFAAENEA